MLLIICVLLLRPVTGQYPSSSDAAMVGTSEIGFAGSDADYGAGERTAPIAPPRVPAIDRPSFGYRPPPPPTRRNAKSSGQCSFGKFFFDYRFMNLACNPQQLSILQKKTYKIPGKSQHYTYISQFIDQRLWQLEPQTAVANAVMFDRATGLTCEECIGKCLHFQDPNSEWVCRSLTFDHQWKICDLFAVNGTNPPHFLTEYYERDYLEYLGAISHSDAHLTKSSGITYEINSKEGNYLVAPQSATSESDVDSESIAGYQAVHRKSVGKSGEKSCRDNDVTRFIMIPSRERVNLVRDSQVVEARSPKECARACDRDETLTCSSAVYTGTECELSVSKAKHKTSDEFIFNDNSTYLEKVCLPASLAEETGKLWSAVQDHILVGHVMEVIDASSLTDCLVACLRAEHEFSFVCRSAMWYPNDDDQNCLLNSVSRKTQSNVFVAEDQGVRMLYFEIPRTENQKLKSGTDLFRDDPVTDDDDYTKWSLCNSSGLQLRYLKCKENRDVRKCPKQTKSCEHATKSKGKSECMAMRDSHNRKKCPHGIRKLPDGRNEYCREPVDCDL